MDDWLEAAYEDAQNGAIDDTEAWEDGDAEDTGCEVVGEPWIGKDGLQYVEVRQWNYHVGEWDYSTIPTTAIPDGCWED